MANTLYEIKNELIILHALFEYGQQVLILLTSHQSLPRNQRDALLIFDQSTQATGLFLSFMPQSTLRSDFKSVAPSLICMIGRGLMENFLAIQYLAKRRSPDDLTFEQLIREQFIDVQRNQMVAQINPSNQELPKLKEAIESRKKAIESHPLYKNLRPEVANNCAIGSADKTQTKNEILDTLGIVPDVFWSTYQHFSQFIHANSFAAEQLSMLGKAGTLEFLRTLTRDIVGIYCLNLLALSYGFNIPQDEVPLNIQDSLLFWQGFYQGGSKSESSKDGGAG